MTDPTWRARTLGACAFAVLLSACGSGSSTVDAASSDDGGTASTVEATPTAADVAAANMELLEPATDARDHDVLVVDDGSIASLRESVDGERPVLLWFWAPH